MSLEDRTAVAPGTDRLLSLFQAINRKTFDRKALARLSLAGLPDDISIRPLFWLLMFKILPDERHLFPETIDALHRSYREQVVRVFSPDIIDKKMIFEIYKDVMRTNSTLHWFAFPDDVESGPISGDFGGALQTPLISRRYCALFRVLYTLAAELQFYSQGLNEIAGLTLQTFGTERYELGDVSIETPNFGTEDMRIEALTYSAYRAIALLALPLHIYPDSSVDGPPPYLLSGTRIRPADLMVKVQEKITAKDLLDFLEAHELLVAHEAPDLAIHLAQAGIRAFMYVSAWAPPLFCRLFSLPDARQCLDLILGLACLERERHGGELGNEGGLVGVLCFSVAIMLNMKPTLLAEGDFSKLMDILQRPPCLSRGVTNWLRKTSIDMWRRIIPESEDLL